jgi:hypothetical protein
MRKWADSVANKAITNLFLRSKLPRLPKLWMMIQATQADLKGVKVTRRKSFFWASRWHDGHNRITEYAYRLMKDLQPCSGLFCREARMAHHS